ncbi:MAG: HEPN domain-containing protein [Candidatus Methanoperedens sp.]|nr:HEPN domain-containing protein [Candidatus Methanoperedens sp.]
MDDPRIKEVFQWLIKAEHDIGSARRLLSGDIPYLDTAVYHCQQAAEKSLKAYLTLKETPFQKIHDLSFLIEQCKELDIEFEQLKNISFILTPYAIAFRYPGDVIEPDPQDADEALRLAVEVFDFVLNKMPADVKKALLEQKI